jgi:hypothetical protein
MNAASHLERPKLSATTLSSGKQATMHRARRLALIPLTRRGASLSQNLSHHEAASTSSALRSLPLRVPLRGNLAVAFVIGAFHFLLTTSFGLLVDTVLLDIFTHDSGVAMCIFDTLNCGGFSFLMDLCENIFFWGFKPDHPFSLLIFRSSIARLT